MGGSTLKKLRILRVEDDGPFLSVTALDIDSGKHVRIPQQTRGSWAEDVARQLAAGVEVVIEVDESKIPGWPK